MVFLPTPYYAGVEVEFRAWPRLTGLMPLDDEAKRIVAYYKANKHDPDLPPTPFRDGKLNLPLLGLPVWRLGESYRKAERDAEDPVLHRAIGHHVMGTYRQTHSVFNSIRWPEPDVIPLNEQAKLIVAEFERHQGKRLDEPAWDTARHRVLIPATDAA